MGRIIGIDLGTTNSVAAYWKRNRPRIIDNEYSTFTPSVVWIENGITRVGRDAKDRLETGSSNIIYSIKRFMGVDYKDPSAQEAIIRSAYKLRQAENGEVEVLLDGDYYSPMQISAMILKQIKRDAEITLGEEVTHAVITVPAYFGQRQKNATREAGRLAGLVVPRIIPEPTAAALAFGVEEEVDEPKDVLVYDLGGGTFDVSVLSIIDNNFDVLNIDGDRFLGGDDFDNLLVQEMLDHVRQVYRVDLQDDPVARMRLKSLAEKAKIELSRQEETRIIGDAIALSGAKPLNLDMTLTRDQFEGIIGDLVRRSVDIVHRALEGAGIKPSDLDRVLLVGGSTRVPIIRRQLKEIFGDKIEIDVDPLQCVSLGAAVQTAFLSEEELQGSIEAQEITPTTGNPVRSTPMGPVVIDKAEDLPEITMQDMISKFIGIETEGGEIVSVIPKGTLYPTHELFRQVFHTNRSGQQVYELPIYESESEDVPKEKWEWIGVVRNRRLPPGLPKSSDIMVEMSIDKDGILSVTSYLKNDPLRSDPEKGTLENRSFHFVSENKRENQAAKAISDVGFNSFMLSVIAEEPSLNRYLSPDEIQTAVELARQAEGSFDAKDAARAERLMEQIVDFRSKLPNQILAMFRAYLITNNKDVVTLVERNEVLGIIDQMESAGDRGDMDTASQHLRQLWKRTDELLEKYPSDLLVRK